MSDADVRNELDPRLVEDTAYGLSALESPLWRKPVATWIAMDERQRELYRAKARFVQVSRASEEHAAAMRLRSWELALERGHVRR
jgi:hypothetical protein